jgi:hypothetical protein
MASWNSRRENFRMSEPLVRRLRLRYSMRTLLLSVSLAAVWFGNQANWIRQRHEFVERFAGLPTLNGLLSAAR